MNVEIQTPLQTYLVECENVEEIVEAVEEVKENELVLSVQVVGGTDNDT